MIEKMIDHNIIDYYIINWAIPSIITIENRYQIDFRKPVCRCGVGDLSMSSEQIKASCEVKQVELSPSTLYPECCEKYVSCPVSSGVLGSGPVPEIGRASCRERV